MSYIQSFTHLLHVRKLPVTWGKVNLLAGYTPVSSTIYSWLNSAAIWQKKWWLSKFHSQLSDLILYASVPDVNWLIFLYVQYPRVLSNGSHINKPRGPLPLGGRPRLMNSPYYSMRDVSRGSPYMCSELSDFVIKRNGRVQWLQLPAPSSGL